MLSTNALSIFILHHKQNRVCNKNIRSIQDIMRVSDPANEKFKRVCNDFPNITILAKSATPGEVQMTFITCTLEKNPCGNNLLHFPWKDHLTHLLSLRLMPTSPLPSPATRSACILLRYSSALPPATSQGPRIRGTGSHSMSSFSHHS